MLWVAILALIAPGLLRACTCGEITPAVKPSWQRADLVFVGMVTGARPLHPSMMQQMVWVHVDEAFKGVRFGETVALNQPGHSCASKFQVGSRLLFYVNRGEHAGSWSTSVCQRTTRIDSAGDDLLFLRALPGSAERTRLSGRIHLHENSPAQGWRLVRSIENWPVLVRGEGIQRSARTNAQGVYEIYDLPAGDYEVQIRPPSTTVIRTASVHGSKRDTPSTTKVRLSEAGTGGVDFDLAPDVLISGRLLDAAGRPISGVRVKLEPAIGIRHPQFQSDAITRQDGSFEIADVAAGLYVLLAEPGGWNSSVPPFPKLFFPGTQTRAEAKLLALTSGQRFKDVVFRFPKLPGPVELRGTVRFSNGVPAKGVSVIFTAEATTTSTRTRDDGTFALTVFPYQQAALWAFFSTRDIPENWCPEFRQATRAADQMEIRTSVRAVSAQKNTDGLVLVFPVQSCWVKAGSSVGQNQSREQ